MSKRVIIIGAGGHAKVIADIIEKSGDIVEGFLDDNLEIGKKVLDNLVIGKVTDVEKFKEFEFIIGIGDNRTRKKIATKYDEIKYYTAVHPSAILGRDVKIGKGTVIMANAVVNVSAIIEEHNIINTGSIVEHDNNLDKYVHISPNATLAGKVNVGECTHIGVGATIRNNINICSDVVVGAGGVVVKDIVESGVYVGIPVKRIKDI